MESLQEFSDLDGPTLTFVTFFEDDAAGRRAEQTVSRLIDGIDPDTIVLQQRWRFDWIEEPNAGEEGWLAEADVILVASARHRDLPPTVVEIIERSLSPAVNHPTALVALGLVPADDGNAPRKLFASLEPLSSRLGMRFFSTSAKVSPDQ